MKVVREGDVPSVAVDPAKFTGEIWRTDVLDPVRDDGLSGVRFVYGPGARSHWHIHTDEQAIIVVAGKGLFQWESREKAVVVRSGDWVHVQPGVAHWHGAAPDNTFSHLAVTAGGSTLWRGPVDDATYRAALPPE